MTGHFGFSYIGLIYLLLLFIPNIIWSKRKPEGYTPEKENKALGLFEKVGQAAVTCIALIFSDYNPTKAGVWNIWLALSAFCMICYELCWIRYFKKPTVVNFYKSFIGVPVPLATLPVAAFFLLGVYGKVIWLLLAAAILGIGHIGIHLEHFRQIKKR